MGIQDDERDEVDEQDGDEEYEDEAGEDDGTITLTDESGNEVTFGILGFVEDDGKNYVLLAPVEQLDNEEDETPLDVYIFRYEEFGDGESFSPIEDEAEMARIQAKAEALLAEGEEHDHEGHEH